MPSWWRSKPQISEEERRIRLEAIYKIVIDHKKINSLTEIIVFPLSHEFEPKHPFPKSIHKDERLIVMTKRPNNVHDVVLITEKGIHIDYRFGTFSVRIQTLVEFHAITQKRRFEPYSWGGLRIGDATIPLRIDMKSAALASFLNDVCDDVNRLFPKA